MVLLIDTSSSWTGLAVLQGDRVLAERVVARLGVEELPGAVAALVDVRELRQVAITTGPGSFSGLRAGGSYGIGLAQGRGIPLLGVATFCLVRALATVPATPIVEAGRDRVYLEAVGGEVVVVEMAEIPRGRPIVGWLSPRAVAAAQKADVPLLPADRWRPFGEAARLAMGSASALPYGRVKLSYVTSAGAFRK
ncbi:MAG: hypothetical protein ACREQM_03920 [Candidatus Dormibacteraceae bacterium]